MEALECELQKVTMKRHFRRHLPKGDAKTWPAEAPVDRDSRMRTTKGDDETPLSSAPPKGDAKTWPAEVPVDGGALLRFCILLFCKPFRGRFPVPSQSPFHTGSVSRDLLPLRQVHLAVTLPAGLAGTDSSSAPFPHWQHIPRFAAVAVSGRT